MHKAVKANNLEWQAKNKANSDAWIAKVREADDITHAKDKQELALSQYQIALMFTECSLVMFVVQAIVFSPWVRPETTRWLISPALAILAVALFLVPRASDFTLMLLVIGAVAASAGILSPILTYWISNKAGKKQGRELGKQTAAASLGAAVGSAVGGVLFDVPWLPGASFLVVTALIVLALLFSLGLPNRLVKPTPLDAIPAHALRNTASVASIDNAEKRTG